MELTNLLIMRHELLLTAVVVLLIFAELYFGREEKDKVIPIAAFLFFVIPLLDFCPQRQEPCLAECSAQRN